MDGQAEIGAEALTHRRLVDHAHGQVGRPRVGRRRLKGGAGLVLRDAGGALQGLGRAVQMTNAVAADIDLNAQFGGRRIRRRRLLSPDRDRPGRQQNGKKEKADRSDRGWAETVRPRRLAPGRARTRRDDEPVATDDSLRMAARSRTVANDGGKARPD
jgi:hypothetical protein